MNWLRTTGLRVLLALILSFALWLFVSYSENPDLTAQYQDLPIMPEGLGPGLLIVDQSGLPETILADATVTLRADSETLAQLRTNDVQAYVDLSDLQPGEHLVEVQARVNTQGRRPDVAAISPELLSIRIEQLITRTVPLTIDVTGNVPFSYEARPPRVTLRGEPVEMVQVSGPEGQVSRVAMGLVTADIDRITANYNSPRPVTPVTEDGNPVEGVTVEPSTVNVLVPIVSSAGVKRVPVVPRVIGDPAPGYIVVDVAVEPQFVTLTGSSGPLDEVQSIETQGVDVSGASGTITRTVALQEPPGSRLRVGEPLSATVTVNVQPINRSFTLSLPTPVEIVNPPPGLLFNATPDTIEVTLSASASRLSAIVPSEIEATVDLSGLGPGVYELVPVVSLPDGVVLAAPPPTVTVSLRAPPTPTPAPTPSPVEEEQDGDASGSPTPEATPTEEGAPEVTPAPGAEETPTATPTAPPQ